MSKLFGYYINLDERGDFSADVRNEKMETVFDIHGLEFFADGFMEDKNDIPGLRDHLADIGIIGEYDDLLDTQDFERALAKEKNQDKQRRSAADEEFDQYDFGLKEYDHDDWEEGGSGDELVRTIWLENEKNPDANLKGYFTVRFKPYSAEVVESYGLLNGHRIGSVAHANDQRCLYLSIDGGKTYVKVDREVRVYWEVPSSGASPEAMDRLSLTLTNDGMITDLVSPEGEIIGTDSEMADDIAARIDENNEPMPNADEQVSSPRS